MTISLSGSTRFAVGLALAVGLGSAAQAQRVARDAPGAPLRPATADETRALGAVKVTRPPVGLITGRVNPQPKVHADGTVEQELDTSTLSYSVMRRNADGTLSQYCVTGNESAEKLVQGGAASAKLAAHSAKEHRHDVK